MPREGTIIADRYRLERKVGGGRVSATWRVQDEFTDAPCAIKLLHKSMHKHPEALTRFSLEERLARELAGAYFPERIGSGSWNAVRYIAWRWYEGESLRTLFERNPKQDAPTVQSIVQETCQALSVVHSAGYVHGDLKPENLFFADRGESDPTRQLKLLGFGVASRIGPASSVGAQARRRPGEIVGTPLYLSPDQVLGRVPKGGQADLWALAVIVYEALTGRAPFLGQDLGEVLEAILQRRAPKPSELADHLPPTLDLWWAQALEQEFSSPNEFAGALGRALAPALRSSRTQRSALLPDRVAAPIAAIASEPPAATRGPSLSGTAAGVGPDAVSATAAMAGAAGLSGPTGLSGTAAGVGPAALSAAAALGGNSAALSSTAMGVGPGAQAAPMKSIEGLKPAAKGGGTPFPGMFAPLPSPLRDLKAGLSRKTLVGITPPSSLAPAPIAAVGTASVAGAGPTRVIEGAPCRAIEVTEAPVELSLDSVSNGVEDLRRSSATMPFPRPRFLARHSAAEPDTSAEGSVEQSARAFLAGMAEQPAWRETTRSLRFVLKSPDHKPQRIAAVVVCAAAALVIFFVGRSPIAGTGTIGQTRSSLSTEPGQTAKNDSTGLTTTVRPGGPAATDPGVNPPPEESGAVDPGITAGDVVPGAPRGSDSPDEAPSIDEEIAGEPNTASPKATTPGGRAQPRDELAPGLKMPPTQKTSAPAPPRPAARPPRPAPPRPPTTGAAPRTEPGPQRAPAARPQNAPEPPATPRRSSGEFDFGI